MLPLTRSFVAVIALLVFATSAHARLHVVAYVPNWVDLNSFAERIDYAKLTHINIAFENPTNAEGDLSSLLTAIHETVARRSATADK